ncbi:MAG: MBL fold metallo-hydrolase [Tissierellia bacterium]|nr:MBL fold metallo-hydrolase [Tissierellia bacterium]MDD4726337.1 MBL fold metallo-hydrolase [Tissierellia bacterium]
MNIYKITAGIYAVNCYIVYSNKTKDTIVIDPGGDAGEIIKFIDENNLNLKYIVLTHGHGDHIGGVPELKSYYNVPLLIHEDDVELLIDCNKNLSNMMAMGCIEMHPDAELKHNDVIEFGDINAQVLHTPGHTKGGISLKIANNVISGDTLFNSSIGRSDLYGGNTETLIDSIKSQLMTLPEDTIVLPGHGLPTSIKFEKYNNPFL